MSVNHSNVSIEGIAIVSMAGRFPGARNLDEFWRNLREGVESVTFFSEEELAARGIDERLLRDPSYVKANCVLDDIELFDASFFGFTPREAEVTDPQHRLFLECAWEAMECAGYDAERFAGRIGVFAGVGMSTYLLHNLIPRRDILETVSGIQLNLGNNKDYVPTRVSYKLNLRGPSININTACSSSLVAVHVACQSLLDYQCDMALAGGVGIQVPQVQGYLYHESGILSPDGHCRAFDAEARGTISGNGVGIVVLKRLEEAINDGDTIHAVICGSAINNDGSDKVGFTAPSVNGQAEVIVEALALSEIHPETIAYIETHGTGTALGDPVEIAALTQAFRMRTDRKGFCAIGSVKTNVGHLDEAAGVAGLIKTILALKHGIIPPSLNYQRPNPQIDFANSPFFVNTKLSEWPKSQSPRRAGVSSFGIGGTNCHVVLEEAPRSESTAQSREWHILPLSAKTDSALEAMTERMIGHLQPTADDGIPDVAFTLQNGRKAFERRHAVICRTPQEAVGAFASRDPKRFISSVAESTARPVVFMFSGQGAQYVNMGMELWRTEPIFRETLNQCLEKIGSHLDRDLRQVIFPGADDTEQAAEMLKQTAYTQPALFCIEYALARQWMGWGIQPEAAIGHSIGEYVAACLAGVFSLEDALALVAARGRLMQDLPAGAMLAVPMPENKAIEYVTDDVVLALMNAPSLCVFSGMETSIDTLSERLRRDGIEGRLLQTSHAFHSPMMEPILKPFADLVRRIDMHHPRIPVISNVTGNWLTAEQATSAEYWTRHLRETVRFSDGIERLMADNNRVFLEIGPGRTLCTFVNQHHRAGVVTVSSLRHPQEENCESAYLMMALSKLWTAGVDIDWAALYRGERRKRIPLPTYPFERKRYWIEPFAPAAVQQARNSDFKEIKNNNVSEWFYIPSWKRTILPAGAVRDTSCTCWIIFVDNCGIGEEIGTRLQVQGYPVIFVQSGEWYERSGGWHVTIDPSDATHYMHLFDDLHKMASSHIGIIHAWNITSSAAHQFESRESIAHGYYSLLYLAQALNRFAMMDAARITVLTDGLMDVTGEEPLHPDKSLSLGPLTVMAQEFPEVRCQWIDLHSDEIQDMQLIERIIADIQSGAFEQAIAYRGAHRWVPEYQPVRLDEIDKTRSQLREGGVYLITGGMGGIGLILADYLARTYRAKLILVGRTELSSQQEEQSAPDIEGREFHSNRAWNDWLDAFQTAESKAGAERSIRGLSDYPGLETALDRLCAAMVYDFLRESEVDASYGTSMPRSRLIERLGVRPEFEKFVDYFVHVLEEDGILRCENETIRFVRSPVEVPDSKKLIEETKQNYPQFTGTLELLEHCVKHYREALSGAIPAIGVLYPEGRADLLERAGERTVPYSKRDIYIRALSETIVAWARKHPDGKLRILEFGAGDGIITKTLAPLLAGCNVEYHVTDLGRSFVMKLKKEAVQSGLDFVRFGVLDITRDPAAQGFASGEYDLVFGLDVIHATPVLSDSVRQLQKLLSPDGKLVLIETVRSPRWMNMIWGLAEGWWYFKDRQLRTTTPLLALDQWEELFRTEGFIKVAAFPRASSEQSKSDYGVVIAGNTDGCLVPTDRSVPTTTKARFVQRLETYGAEVMTARGDVADREQMKGIVSDACKRFGRIHGVIHAAGVTDRETIFNTIPDTTFQESEALFQAKVYGTKTLSELFADEPLDFMMLVSSNAATLGGLGFCAYTAASNFLDAYAVYQRHRLGRPWISANWDGWPTHEVTGLDAGFQTSIDRYAMTRAEAEMAFERVLRLNTARIVVSAGDLKARLARWKYGAREEAAQSHTERTLVDSFHQRPALTNQYVEPRTDVERTLSDIWQDLLGIDRIGIEDNFFDLDGDSLLGTQLISRVGKQFGLELPFRLLFEEPTIAGLAGCIERIQSSVRQLQVVPTGEVSEDEDEGEI